ncbi:MAG: hypothetical protein HYT76_03385 [Deltaproteobacteria bacterium]|nr:hypothetical protein [Deltaproteobacteria bacterium]
MLPLSLLAHQVAQPFWTGVAAGVTSGATTAFSVRLSDGKRIYQGYKVAGLCIAFQSIPTFLNQKEGDQKWGELFLDLGQGLATSWFSFGPKGVLYGGAIAFCFELIRQHSLYREDWLPSLAAAFTASSLGIAVGGAVYIGVRRHQDKNFLSLIFSLRRRSAPEPVAQAVRFTTAYASASECHEGARRWMVTLLERAADLKAPKVWRATLLREGEQVWIVDRYAGEDMAQEARRLANLIRETPRNAAFNCETDNLTLLLEGGPVYRYGLGGVQRWTSQGIRVVQEGPLGLDLWRLHVEHYVSPGISLTGKPLVTPEELESLMMRSEF